MTYQPEFCGACFGADWGKYPVRLMRRVEADDDAVTAEILRRRLASR